MKKIQLLVFFLFVFTAAAMAQIPVMNPIAGPSVVCSAPTGPMTFSASANNSPTSYSWSVVNPGGVIIGSPTQSITTISFPYSFGTYTVYCSATNGFGTSPTTSFVVTVFETPSVTFSGNNYFCQGTSTNLQASSTILQASPTISYSWMPNYGLNAYNIPNVNANPSITTVYTVVATKGICSNSAQITVSVLPSPTLIASANPSFICQGQSSTLTASGASTISWSGGVINGVGFFPSFTQNYTVTGTNPNGCSTQAVRTVSVNTPPNVSPSASSPTVCSGNTLVLTGNGAGTYTWSNGVINGVPFTPTATNNYTLSGSTAGCPGTSTASILVSVNPTPTMNAVANFTSICSGESTSITINGSADTYSINGVNSSTFTIVSPTTTTTYTITGKTIFNCYVTQIITIQVSPCTAVKELAEMNATLVKVYPNPSEGKFIVNSGKNQTLYISNELGQLILSSELKAGVNHTVQGLDPGIYFIRAGDYKARVIVIK